MTREQNNPSETSRIGHRTVRDRLTKLTRGGRRGFIKRLAGLGVSASSINLLTQEAVAEAVSKPDKEVPYASEIRIKNHDPEKDSLPNEPLETETVVDTMSRNRWQIVETAVDAARQVQKVADARLDNPVSATVRAESPTEQFVEVQAGGNSQSIDKIRERLPQKVTGVAGRGTEFESRREVQVNVRGVNIEFVDKFTSSYRPIPGGARQDAYPDYDPDHIVGTTAGPFYSNDDSERQMLTAAHNFIRRENNKDYKNIHQPGKDYLGDNRVGTRDSYKWSYTVDNSGNIEEVIFDAGLWSPESEFDFTLELAEDGGGYRQPIGGIVTWDTIKNKNGDTSYTIKKQGAATGIESGYIDNIDSVDRRFQTTANGEAGDSGGPFFHENSSGEALIAGVVSTALDFGDRTGGNDIEHVMNEFNLSL